MADSTRRVALTTEIAKLRKQQLEAMRNATFLGWNPDSVAAYESREDQLAELQQQLRAGMSRALKRRATNRVRLGTLAWPELVS